jgi:hypothetical protein
MDTLSYQSVSFRPISPYRHLNGSRDANPNEIVAERFLDRKNKLIERVRIYLVRDMARWYSMSEMNEVNPMFDLEVYGRHEWYVLGTVFPPNHPDMNAKKIISPTQRRGVALLEKEVLRHMEKHSLPNDHVVLEFRLRT